MLARFFKKSQPISFVSLLLLLFIYIGFHFFHTVSSPFVIGDLLQNLGVYLFFSFILFLIDFIIKRNSLTAANYYAVFFFVVLFGLFPDVLHFSKIGVSHLFILFAFRRIYSIYTKKEVLLKLFDSGFYIGIAFLLYPLTFVYVLLIYIAYSIYIRVLDKNIFIPIIGFITPIFIVFSYYYFFEKLSVFRNLVEINLSFDYRLFEDKLIYIPLLLILLLIFISFIKVISNHNSLGAHGKDNLIIILSHLLISVFIIVLNTLEIKDTMQFIFFPTAVLIGNFIFFIKKIWIKEVLLYSIIILSFWVILI